MHNPIPAALAIYARKSTESEDRQVLSIDSQVKELKAFAEREGIRVSQVFIEAKSAKSPGRPVFNELFSLVQKGKIDAVMSWKLDRIARNPVDGGAVIWAMEERQLQAIYTPQRVFLNTGNDKFWMQLEFGMAKKYVDDLSDNVKRGIKAKTEAGWFPSYAPIGYLNDRNTHTIIKDPERFPLIRRIWDAVLAGDSSVAKVLERANNEWGLRTRPQKRRGGGPLCHSEIFRLLRDPFYYGVFALKSELYRGSHEPMISKAEYDRVQEILRCRSRQRPKKLEFLYGGLLRCGACGCAVTAEYKNCHDKYHYTYYHCTRQKQGFRCTQPSIQEKDVTTQIEAFLGSISIHRPIADWILRIMFSLEEEEATKLTATKTSLAARVSACDRELKELLNVKLRGLLSDEEFVRKKYELESERVRLAEARANLKGEPRLVTDRCNSFIEFSSMVLKNYQIGTMADRRQILAATASKLVLLDRKLSICAHKPFDIISSSGSTQEVQTESFETREVGSVERRIESPKTARSVWQGLADDVRNFFRGHVEGDFPFLRLHKDMIKNRRRL